jgi:hypothetical protein
MASIENRNFDAAGAEALGNHVPAKTALCPLRRRIHAAALDSSVLWRRLPEGCTEKSRPRIARQGTHQSASRSYWRAS